jgi:hypothetical protein
MRTPFLGAHVVARSQNLADQILLNLYAEVIEGKSGKDVAALFMAPGLDQVATGLGNGPSRGACVMGNLLYVVAANTLYSISLTWVVTSIGTIGTNAGPVSMITNGTQLNIFDGTNGYLYSVSGGLSTLSLPFTNPGVASYQDGFGLVNQNGTQNVYASASGDLSSYPALSFGAANGRQDNTVATATFHRELWIFKQTSIEVWDNAGLANFAFQRNTGVFIEGGCVAAYSVARAGEALLWLAQNDQGQAVVVMAEGYVPKRVSTHAIEYEIKQLQTVADAIAHVHQEEGHVFYVLTFPTGNRTFCLDVTTMIWHTRGAFANGQVNRHWANCFAAFNGRNVIGDYQSGNLLAYNLDTLTDNGKTRKWVRTWRALPKPTDDPVSFYSLRIDMETGSRFVPSGTAPQCMLRWSDDGGHTWSDQRIIPVGSIGQTALRVKFNRLGSTRRNSGLDRIFELSSTDQFRVALIGAELDAA